MSKFVLLLTTLWKFGLWGGSEYGSAFHECESWTDEEAKRYLGFNDE